MNTAESQVDIAIFGGGVAGLWIQNRLENLGFSTVLLESNALGGGQTLRSQGIIHGGTKYALKGLLTSSVDPVREMPTRWKNCLTGQGEINLQNVKTLSDAQYLWSTGHLSSDLLSFFGSFALTCHVQKLKKSDYPTLLQHPSYKGYVFKLDEIVLDTTSLIRTLAHPYQNKIFKMDMAKEFLINFKETLFNRNQNAISSIQIQQGEKSLKLHAKYYILTAGSGNEILSKSLSEIPLMQRRPLQMVYVIFEDPVSPLFGHCMDGGTNPRISITTHTTSQGKTVWYLGGELAEQGVKRTREDQIVFAQKELKTLFPWVDFSNTHWNSFLIDRAEGKQIDGKRPSSFSLHTKGNVITAWPTKLALTPKLSDEIIAFLQKETLQPSSGDLSGFKDWQSPSFAIPAWNE